MKKHCYTLLCLLLLLTLCMLPACGGGEQPPSEDPPGETPGDETPGGNETPGGDETPGGGEDEPPATTGKDGFPADTQAPYTPIPFGSLAGGAYDAAAPDNSAYPGGASLASDVFPLAGRKAGESVTLTARELLSLLRADQLEAKIYRLSDSAPLQLDRASRRTYRGNGAVILSSAPLRLINCTDITLQDLTWINIAGNAMEIENSTPICMEGVEAAGQTAVLFDDTTSELTLRGCRLIAHGDGLVLPAASRATVIDTAFSAGGTALSLAGQDVLIENCVLNAPAGGMLLQASEASLTYSTLRGSLQATRCENMLLGGNLLYGSETTLVLQGGYNISCVRNRLCGVRVTGTHAAYLVDNYLDAGLAVLGSDYILADGNLFAEGAGATVQETGHPSGDSLLDVDARAEAGAKEELLPQVDRDLFVSMTRKRSVRCASGNEKIVNFIATQADAGGLVFVPPGAYATDVTLAMSTKRKGVTVYAYGVLLERDTYGGHNLYIEETDHLTIKGLALGHPINSSGNTVVVGKRDGRYIDLLAGAGMLPDWTDKRYYSFTGLNQTIYGYRPGHPEPYADMGTQAQSYDQESGLITLKVSEVHYAMIEVGDTITCRGAGATAIQSTRADSLTLQDVTVYGAAGFCLNDSQSKGDGIRLLRMLDTTAAAPVIDQETYDRYRAAEEQYQVSFGVRIDEKGRLRGTPHKMSSVDATHSSHSKTGLQAISCLFESMCDDGTNQCSAHARMAGWQDLGDGRIELLFKTNISAIGLANDWGGSTCILFSEGERVYLYRTDGLLVCDTVALSDARLVRTQKNEYNKTDSIYAVTIAKEALDFTAIEGVDLETASPSVLKVCVDNRSWQSDRFLFDNCLVRNIRSRGLLLKGSDGVVKNCSIISTGMAAINIGTETEWGESGISQHLLLQNNYMENSGHYSNATKNSAIYIHNLGNRVNDQPYLNVKDITIEGNVIVGRNTDYAIYAYGVEGLTIRDNDFGTRRGVENDEMPPIRLEGVRRVTVEGNRYPDGCQTPEERLSAYLYEGLGGADAEGYPPDELVGDQVDAFLDNTPIWDAQGNVTYRGNWQIGSLSRTTGTGFSPFTTYLGDVGWLCHSRGQLWGGTGGVWITQNYSFAAQKNYNVALAYTAPVDGVYKIRLASYSPPGGDGVADGLFAVVKNNGEFVYPVQGNKNYDADSSYLQVNGQTNATVLQKAFEEVEVTLKAGDVLYFTARRMGDSGWSRFSMLPIVIKPEK